MDFTLSEEQILLEQTAERVAAEMARQKADEPGAWRILAEAGLLALPISENDGGLGLGAVETMIVLEALAGQAVTSSYLGSVVLAGTLLDRLAEESARSLLGALAAGEARPAFAHCEPQARHVLADVETTARREGDGYRLDGRKIAVLAGPAATHLLVSARTAGEAGDEPALSVFLLEPGQPGVTVSASTSHSGAPIAELVLEDVSVPDRARLGPEGAALPAIEAAYATALVAGLAEAGGLCGQLMELTAEHLRSRKQFGKPLASFQALQHRAADMLCGLELVRSMAIYATAMLDAEPASRDLALVAAKASVNKEARAIGQAAVQLHGGLGLTVEHPVGRLFKRLTELEILFGDTDHHLSRLADSEAGLP